MAEVTPGAVASDEVPPVAATEATPAPDVPVDQESDSPEGAVPVKPEKTYSQKEYEEAISKRLAKESRRLERTARAEAEAALYKRQLEELRAPQAEKPSGAPKPEDFKGDYEGYLVARAKYEIKLEQETAGKESKAQQEDRQAEDHARYIQERLSVGAEEFADFEEVALAKHVPITNAMAAAIADSEAPAKVAYYLGSHLDEAKRISQLKPTRQVVEVHAIEAKVMAAPEPTRTPAPIKPNSATASVETRLENAGGYQDFVKIRNRQLAAKRGR